MCGDRSSVTLLMTNINVLVILMTTPNDFFSITDDIAVIYSDASWRYGQQVIYDDYAHPTLSQH